MKQGEAILASILMAAFWLSCLAYVKGSIEMADKLKALLKSRRFYVAVGGVLVVVLSEGLGLDEKTAQNIVTIAVGWIIGDSLNKTE